MASTSTDRELEAAFPPGLTLAEKVSRVPPVPQAVVNIVAQTSFGKRLYDWDRAYPHLPIIQIITALVLLERSRAGRAWNVKLGDVPEGASPADSQYSIHPSGSKLLNECGACVEWFYQKSSVSLTAPMATVTWDPRMQETLIGKNWPATLYTCNALCRMLYAAEALEGPPAAPGIDLTMNSGRLDVMEQKIAELEAMKQEIAELRASIATLSAVPAGKVPLVTCLMHLFAFGTMMPPSTTDPAELRLPCNLDHDTGDTGALRSGTSTSGDTNRSTAIPNGASGTTAQGIPLCPPKIYCSIAPHTQRLIDLSPEAQRWFFDQLETHSVWVRATDPDSNDNHISWQPFEGAVEMDRRVVFSHGNHRFW